MSIIFYLERIIRLIEKREQSTRQEVSSGIMVGGVIFDKNKVSEEDRTVADSVNKFFNTRWWFGCQVTSGAVSLLKKVVRSDSVLL